MNKRNVLKRLLEISPLLIIVLLAVSINSIFDPVLKTGLAASHTDGFDRDHAQQLSSSIKNINHRTAAPDINPEFLAAKETPRSSEDLQNSDWWPKALKNIQESATAM